LTRVVDKRRVRRDHADVFSTTAEGMKGRRAVEWKLVDAVVPRSRWAAEVKARAEKLAAKPSEAPPKPASGGVALPPIAPQMADDGSRIQYKYVTLALDRARRTAELTVQAPVEPEPTTPAELLTRGAEAWALRAFRELDDALLR